MEGHVEHHARVTRVPTTRLYYDTPIILAAIGQAHGVRAASLTRASTGWLRRERSVAIVISSPGPSQLIVPFLSRMDVDRCCTAAEAHPKPLGARYRCAMQSSVCPHAADVLRCRTSGAVFDYGTAGFRTHASRLDAVAFRAGAVAAARSAACGSAATGLVITARPRRRVQTLRDTRPTRRRALTRILHRRRTTRRRTTA